MLIKGELLRFGGNSDVQKEIFSKDCKVKFLNSIQELPVVFASDFYRTKIGSIKSLSVDESGMSAVVEVDPAFQEVLAKAKAVVPQLGMAVIGYVDRGDDSRREDGIIEINSFTMSGVMVGINVDLDIRGFDYLDPNDSYTLIPSPEINWEKIGIDSEKEQKAMDADIASLNPHASMLTQCHNDCMHCDCWCEDILADISDKEAKDKAEKDLLFERAYDDAYGRSPSEYEPPVSYKEEGSCIDCIDDTDCRGCR